MTAMQIVSRQEAKERGLTRYFTGKPCKHGHVDEKYVVNGSCVVCTVCATQRHQDKMPEGLLREYNKARYSKGRDRFVAYSREYKSNNRPKYRALDAKRRAQKIAATPPWLSREQHAEMARHYEVSDRLTRVTGVGHHVDHIVPLLGKNVCGLHVPWNLQVIPAKENISKGNRLAPVLPETQFRAIMHD